MFCYGTFEHKSSDAEFHFRAPVAMQFFDFELRRQYIRLKQQFLNEIIAKPVAKRQKETCVGMTWAVSCVAGRLLIHVQFDSHSGLRKSVKELFEVICKAQRLCLLSAVVFEGTFVQVTPSPHSRSLRLHLNLLTLFCGIKFFCDAGKKQVHNLCVVMQLLDVNDDKKVDYREVNSVCMCARAPSCACPRLVKLFVVLMWFMEYPTFTSKFLSLFT